jgi:hypothetical protein
MFIPPFWHPNRREERRSGLRLVKRGGVAFPAMSEADPRLSLELAFERIEETILPSLAMMLDTLLEAATLARPGEDCEVHAAELRTIGYQLEDLTRQIEAMSPAHLDIEAPAKIRA